MNKPAVDLDIGDWDSLEQYVDERIEMYEEQDFRKVGTTGRLNELKRVKSFLQQMEENE